MIYEFFDSIIFSIIAILLSFFIVSLNDLFVEESYDTEKSSAYECGFQPIDLNLQQFDVKFYVVGLLFLIFDIETVFLLPYMSVSHMLNVNSFFCLFFFVLCFYVTFINP